MPTAHASVVESPTRRLRRRGADAWNRNLQARSPPAPRLGLADPDVPTASQPFLRVAMQIARESVIGGQPTGAARNLDIGSVSVAVIK